jgi:hypothetical protein
MHNGLDVGCPVGTECVAPVDGKVIFATESGFSGGGMIHFEFQEDLGDIKAGDVIGWGHIFDAKISSGNVSGGKVIATSGNAGSGPHVHFVYLPGGNNGGSQWDGTADPEKVYDYLMNGEAPTGIAGGGGAGSGASANAEGLAKAAAFATFFNLASVMDVAEAQALKGERSLMNDEPLMPFVQQLTEASMRNFQSMPNGNFFAFYPDYFGGMGHRTPYWSVSDTEIIDGNINLSDDALATHVYVVGSWFQGGNQANPIGLYTDKIHTKGVVTIFNAFMIDFLNGTTDLMNPEGAPEELGTNPLTKKDNAVAFLKKYGARPHYEEQPFIKNEFYEIFLAFQRFCLLWSQQFSTQFQLTFMPEIFPGGLIEFREHSIQCYVDEVTHSCNYTSGFTTTISISSPASTDRPDDPNQNRNVGMVRANIFETIQNAR